MAMQDPTAVRRLNNGVEIPRIGLGVYQARPGEETKQTVLEALRIGYRHIDTARAYRNERDVGDAVRESGIPRSKIFVTTKLWNSHQGYDSALRAFDESAARLDLGPVDLFLLHWPVPELRLESWRALERLAKEGRVRAIGVSNFVVHHLEELLAKAEIVPAVNQIELTPFLQHRDVRAFCTRHEIAIEAYSPLTRGKRLDHPVVVDVAKQLGRTPAQVLLRWGLQKDLIVLPKSVHADRIRENFELHDFSLPDKEIIRLDALEEGLAIGWNPRQQT